MKLLKKKRPNAIIFFILWMLGCLILPPIIFFILGSYVFGIYECFHMLFGNDVLAKAFTVFGITTQVIGLFMYLDRK